MFDRLQAMLLLQECTGDDLWSIDYCLQRGVPGPWIDELSDCFESGFRTDSQTIYLDRQTTNQYEGVRDVDLAIKLGEYLGVKLSDTLDPGLTRARVVQSIREAVEEG